MDVPPKNYGVGGDLMNPSLDTSSVWSRHPKSKESESTASFQIHGGGVQDLAMRRYGLMAAPDNDGKRSPAGGS